MRFGLPGKTLRIAVSVGVNIRIGKWIVSRDCTVCVQPENLTVERRKILCESRSLRVAHCPIQLSVRSELDSAAVVVIGAGNIVDENLIQTALASLGVFAQAHKPILQPPVSGSIGISHVDKTVL